MESSFFSDFGLMWYLEELQKEEFKQFKAFLKHDSLQPGLRQIPWAEVKKATREELVNLLTKHYGEQQAWDVTLTIFDKISRKDLCEKAKTERSGHKKRYQAHIKERLLKRCFRGEAAISTHNYFENKEHEYMEQLFPPQATGTELPHTVILIGNQKLGKTTFLTKLLLTWAEGTLYQEKFSYVFYFCCQEVKHLAVTSLSELISRGWPGSPAPLGEILSQPRKLLFLIDSLEKLTGTSNELWSDTCSDCVQQQPVQVILTSLMRKKMLPESSVLVATTPEYLQKAEPQLENPEIKPIIGLSEDGKRLYFSCTFQNKNQALEAHNVVKGNKWLYSMCQIPALCWVACTCLKQEVERGRDITLTCHRSTFLFSSFILNTFTSLNAVRPHRKDYLQLEGLCSLAVEGMWTDTFEFSKEDLKRNGLAEGDIPTFLDTKILQKCWAYENCYAFMHKYIQELLAAMFYLLKRPSDHPNPAIKCVKALLMTYLRKFKLHWDFLGCFLFGLLNTKGEERLHEFGFQLIPEVKEQVCLCLKSLGEHELQKKELCFTALCYCLFEVEDKGFVKEALDCFQEVHLSVTDRLDLIVSAYCLKQSSCLRKLAVSIEDILNEEKDNRAIFSYNLKRWYYICSVITTNVHLYELQIYNSFLNETAFVTLCKELRDPSCCLQILRMNNVPFPEKNGFFFEMLSRNSRLKCLDLSHTQLSSTDVRLLCEALNNPLCGVEYLALAGCYIREPFWESVCDVVRKSQQLLYLDLSMNTLKADDLELLCEALRHSDCCVQSLCLGQCSITADGCQYIASVLTSKPNMKNLEIGHNKIQDEGVKLLCDALANPRCQLESIKLNECHLTSGCCEDLASVLTRSKTLKRLNLTENTLDHAGVVVLCEALKDPNCILTVLELEKAKFGEETQKLLLLTEDERKPSLVITANY